MDPSSPMSSLKSPNHKRSYEQMFQDPGHSQCSIPEAGSPSDTPTSAPPLVITSLMVPSFGLQMERVERRPDQDVIDLTHEPTSPTRTGDYISTPVTQHTSSSRIQTFQNGPRHSRSILNTETAPITVQIHDSSPDLEIIQVRERAESHSDARRSSLLPQRLPPPPPPHHHHHRHHSSHSRRIRSPHTRQLSAHTRSRQLPSLANALQMDFGRAIDNRQIGRTGDELVLVNDLDYPHSFRPPDLNFNMQGFNLEAPARPVQQPRLPTYEAPPPAHEGFTRDCNPGDTYVCPNCSHELGVGETDDQKQVWVIMKCGHVYCGECAKNRFATFRNRRQGDKSQCSEDPLRGKPFKKCVVEWCLKPISPRNGMQQAYR